MTRVQPQRNTSRAAARYTSLTLNIIVIYAPVSTPEDATSAASASATSDDTSLAPLLGASEGSVEAVRLVDGPLVAEPVTEPAPSCCDNGDGDAVRPWRTARTLSTMTASMPSFSCTCVMLDCVRAKSMCLGWVSELTYLDILRVIVLRSVAHAHEPTLLDNPD
jgi:hypothetical protein